MSGRDAILSRLPTEGHLQNKGPCQISYDNPNWRQWRSYRESHYDQQEEDGDKGENHLLKCLPSFRA